MDQDHGNTKKRFRIFRQLNRALLTWPYPGCSLALSRFRAALCARLCCLAFEGDRAFPGQCRVASTRIMEAVDIFKVAIPACRLVAHVCRQIGPALMVLKMGHGMPLVRMTIRRSTAALSWKFLCCSWIGGGQPHRHHRKQTRAGRQSARPARIRSRQAGQPSRTGCGACGRYPARHWPGLGLAAPAWRLANSIPSPIW